MNAVEVNFDGLIGPTHHYGGLAAGNLASQSHALEISHPRQAALQGLEKMKLLADRGIRQALLPPHERPHLEFLHSQGFRGPSPEESISRAARERPDLLSIACSASAMWAANAATVSPSADTADHRLHMTPANLISQTHRSLEAPWTTALLRRLFAEGSYFEVHPPLPAVPELADEGAANQMRLAGTHGQQGVEVFVYGKIGDGTGASIPRRFAPRQSREASREIIRRHGLEESRVRLVQQAPEAIDAGVFHNDVIAVANVNVLLCHEQAYWNQPQFIESLTGSFPDGLHIISVTREELPLDEAVRSYLFNSQLVTLPEGGMLLLCPSECESSPQASAVLKRIHDADNPVREVEFVDVRQSMRNGGGPACLRLRVVMTEPEWDAVHSGVKLTPGLYLQLKDWINRHYREELSPHDLADPHIIVEVREALQELSGILNLRSIYPFQQ